MKRRRQVVLNTVLSVVQVAVNGGLYLVLYRFLYDTVGVEGLGVWSVVLAWTSVNSVASLGMGGSAVYFVPKYLARGERPYVVELAQTGVLTVVAAVTVGAAAFYPLVRVVLRLVITEPAALQAAFEVVPYAFASLWLTTTAGVVYSTVDGFQRVDLRNIVLMVGAAVFLGAALVLVPSRGLVGLAQAQLAQGAVVLLGSWAVLRGLLPELPAVPVRWSRRAFSEMIGYSLRFQGISLALLALEPLTKSLLARFGGVSAAGYFEMANRLAVQLRAFVATAHMALVPTLTDIGETAPDRLGAIYAASCRLVSVLVLTALPLLVGLTPLVSVVWLGTYEPTFVLFASLAFVGWFGNMIGNPAYFGYMGSGDIRWNLRSHLLTAGINGALGAAAGAAFGGVGVVAAFTASLLAGSALMAVAYGREHDVPPRLWASPENLALGLATLTGMGAMLLVFARWGSSAGVVPLVAGSLAVYAVAAAGPLWWHPARRPLQAWLWRTVLSLRQT